PCITGDNYTAIYRLTRALIDLGHQQVALFVPGLWSGKSLEIVIDAHTRALREAGLQFIPEAVEFSRKLDHHSLKSMKEFLQHFPDVTAILTTYLDVAIKMAEYADLVDWDIPGRLSLASLQTGRWGTPPMNIFGAQYDWDKIIRKAMELIIDEKFKINENGFSRLVMEPKLNHSQPSSIAPPPQPSK
ncbi:MAG: LacI family transcriptional regulator, partial [Lentisphaerae bacterium]